MLGHQVECPDWKYQFATNKNDFQIYQVENSNFQIISGTSSGMEGLQIAEKQSSQTQVAQY